MLHVQVLLGIFVREARRTRPPGGGAVQRRSPIRSLLRPRRVRPSVKSPVVVAKSSMTTRLSARPPARRRRAQVHLISVACLATAYAEEEWLVESGG